MSHVRIAIATFALTALAPGFSSTLAVSAHEMPLSTTIVVDSLGIGLTPCPDPDRARCPDDVIMPTPMPLPGEIITGTGQIQN